MQKFKNNLNHLTFQVAVTPFDWSLTYQFTTFNYLDDTEEPFFMVIFRLNLGPFSLLVCN